MALLSLVLPDGLDVTVLDGIVDGLLGLASAHQVAVVGGNISRSPGPLVVDVTAVGSAKRRSILRRSGARPGDDVYVTGSIGDALAGLHSLQERRGAGAGDSGQQVTCTACEERFLYPEPRVRVGMLLGRNRAASACMDLSDGLADAIRQVAEASQVGITIDADALPVSDDARQWHVARGTDPVQAALQGGDDYELLFTARPVHRGRLRHVTKHAGGLPITKIGTVTRDRNLVVRTKSGSMALPEGFEHFR
jgi:thiamine-monophosphate kinase